MRKAAVTGASSRLAAGSARRALADLVRTAALCALVAVTVAGCEAVFGPEPSPSVRLVATPEPTPEPAPSELDEFETLPPDPSGSGPSPLAAAQRLADLDSYRVTVSTRGLVPASTAGGAVSMTSTLIQGADPAARFSVTGVAGFSGGRLDAIVIGDQAWLKEGAGSWHKSAGGAADLAATFTTLSPNDLTGGFDALTPAMKRIGTERRNDQPTEHFRADSSSSAAAAAGLVDGSIDLWQATDGGYLVAIVVDGNWVADDGTARRTTLRIDVSRVNDPANRVSPPG